MPTNPADYDRRYRETRKELRKNDAGILLKMMEILQSLHKNVEFLAQEIASLRKDSRAREYITLKPSTESYLESSLVEKPPQRRGTRLPTDFKIDADLIEEGEAVRRKYGLPPIDIQLEGEKFIDHWRAKVGNDGCKLDWRATWRNWCRNARGGKPTAPPPATNGHSPEINEMRTKQLAELASKGIHVLPGSMT